MLFPFSLEGAARTWLEKETPRSIHIWEDLVSNFVNYFFPPSKTHLKNDITNFQQKFDETFSEACDHFKDLLRKCPHHGFLELHQIDTFYNSSTQSDQDSLNATAGGNLLNCTPGDDLTIIKNKSKVRISRNKLIVSKVNTTTSSSSLSSDITTLTDIVKELVLMNKGNQQASVKAVEETCVTCGGPHPYYECLATGGNTFDACAATGTYNQGGNEYHPQGDPNYRASNQMGPPTFPPPNVQNNQNYNWKRAKLQSRKAPLNQAQVGPSNDFLNYIKTNDVNMRAMQNHISNMKTELKNEFKTTMLNQNNELRNMISNEIKNMMSSFIQMQSPSGSGSLPSNTVANPRGDLKAITTQSGVAYDGPTIPSTPSPLPKEMEREIEATKDKVQATSSESTAHVQPPGSDFILEEIETFLRTPNELSTLDDDFDPEGDTAVIEKLLNEDPSLNLPLMKNEDLKQPDVTMTKPSTEEPSNLELKDLPSHLEYAFLEEPINYPS
nr:reverse transcriptase domain-containing protein [Tanacetum cinerariifolium]